MLERQFPWKTNGLSFEIIFKMLTVKYFFDVCLSERVCGRQHQGHQIPSMVFFLSFKYIINATAHVAISAIINVSQSVQIRELSLMAA